MSNTLTSDGPIPLKSKIERWQKKAKISGSVIPAKNMTPALGYKGQQWGSGANRSGPNGGRKKSGLTKRGRFNGQCGPGRAKSPSGRTSKVEGGAA